jgi:DNA repair exonuclease SbcCD nuclease subunit
VRLVHLSDLHLGFRQYQRVTPTGINQREADVGAAFRRAVDATIQLRPDIVLIGGDVFHAVRPPNPAILHAFSLFSRMVTELPGAVVVMVAGNHDTPRSSETGCILRLFRQLGIHVVDGEARTLQFPDRSLNILAVPDLQGPLPPLNSDPTFRYNVLLIHGEVRGVVPRHAGSEDRPTMEIEPAALNAPEWNYVALAHYHVFHEVAPNAFYSGATEYTSSNNWGELQEERRLGIPGKGFIEYDLDAAMLRFHPIQSARVFVDLPAFSARGLTALEVDEMIARRVDECEGGIDDKVVRLVIRDVPRHIARELDHAAIRTYRRRALHFLLDPRRPEPTRTHGQGAPGSRRSLEDTVREKLYARDTDPDIDRQALVDLAISYIRQAEAAAAVEAEA